MVYSIDDPTEMTPSERFQEIAWILASGFLRLRVPGSHLIRYQGGEAGWQPLGKFSEVRELTGGDDIAAKGLDVSHR